MEGRIKKNYCTTRVVCKALLIVSKGKNDGKWVVKNFNNDHNHLMVSPKSVSYLRCHKKMTTVTKSLVEKFHEEGLQTRKVATMFNIGELSFSDRDCWNHLRSFRRCNLDVGIAQVVFDFCRRKLVENHDFFFAIQLDDCDDYMINFFWLMQELD
ncbi:hypothetical protein NMG60_11024042 [Bertholletia excelsa]